MAPCVDPSGPGSKPHDPALAGEVPEFRWTLLRGFAHAKHLRMMGSGEWWIGGSGAMLCKGLRER